MNSRLVEELARQRHAERLAKTKPPMPPCLRRRPGSSLRRNTGWAIVAIGLRIAESGSRHRPVAAASHYH